jgi:hypothetical protein
MKLSQYCLLLLSCSMLICSESIAAPPSPTMSDAHESIRDLVGRNLVRDTETGHTYHNYQGNNCRSLMDIGKKGEVLSIDWSLVETISNSGNTVNLTGPVYLTTAPMDDFVEIPSHRYSANAKQFSVPEPVIANRLSNAMKLLMNACHNKSEFD